MKYLVLKPTGIYVDATVGGGGHSEAILKQFSAKNKLIGIDADSYMLEIAFKRLKQFKNKKILINDNFDNLKSILYKINIREVDGILFDLGVSTEHFAIGERGFSLRKDGPLDMRLNKKGKLTAEFIINNWKAEKLVGIFYKYGEERHAKKIAKCIIHERDKGKINSTKQLAEIVARAISTRKKDTKVPGYRMHPATKVFQALRITVNDELENIKKALPQAIDLLKPGGRLCVIAFHSLEDRLVKYIFRAQASKCICPKEFPECVCRHKPKIKIITKKPVAPENEEIDLNPYSRSAKLRVAEKI